jgi:steroid 5-alpha reductase family enzyme
LLSLAINWGVFYLHALPNDSEKFFDATGSATYLSLTIAAILFHIATSSNFSFGLERQTILPIMTCVWCIRLGSYLLARIMRDGKDARFDEFKKHWLRFMGVWTIQSIWCFVVASPMLVSVTSSACGGELGLLDVLGWSVWIFGFAFEVMADYQKDTFRRDPANKGKFITTGLWSLSRHPNYFGEITMWIGICVSGSSCFQGLQWLAWLSPVTTFVLLMKVSGVPLLEASGEKRWGSDPAYQWYMKNTPCIVPALKPPPPYPATALLPPQ